MEYTYQIIPEHQLVIEIVTGEVTIEELIQKTEKVFTDPAYKAGYVAMMDFRQAVSRMTTIELYGYVDLVSKTAFFGISKAAVIANDPNLVALSQIFKKRMPNQQTFETFSTVEAAAKFVGNPIALNYLSEN